MRLHLVALPHTQVNADNNGCAYTAKNFKFCKMMGDRHEVILYAPEGSLAPGAAEHVTVLTQSERVGIFGPDERNRLPAWPTDEQTALFNQRAAEAILDRAEPGDLVLLTAGRTHLPIDVKLKEPGPSPRTPATVKKPRARPAPRVITCEPGVGYEGVFTGRCAYESYAWRHYVAGKYGHNNNGHWYDATIPNYFDVAEFPHRRPAAGAGDYLLFLGRVNPDKGVGVAGDIAAHLGMPLVIAGAGVQEVAPGRVTGNGVTINGDVEWYGPVTIAERAELLAGAACLLAPTMYVEPFGGVAVEAMMAGTPAVTTDIGAFTETVTPGVSGYRFHTFHEGVQAVEAAMELHPETVQAYAHGRYSLAAVGPQFDRWLARQNTSWHPEGWYAPLPGANAPERVEEPAEV